MNIQSAIKNAIAEYGLSSLEVEILLAHVLQVPRTYLYTHPERPLTVAERQLFSVVIHRKAGGEPIAYITGHREFWTLDLKVTPATLVPRPETELLVELVLANVRPMATVADLGTGSGAIAVALAKERPSWNFYATDISGSALKIAKYNAKKHKLSNIIFSQGTWCQALPPLKFDIIISNPPYIAENDPHLKQGGVAYEPLTALVAGPNGLKDIIHIISVAPAYLKKGGYLLLEHGYQQAEKVQKFFYQRGYTKITTENDLSGLQRVTMGQWVS